MKADLRRLGDREVVAIGQGTWQLEDDDRAGAIAALRRGIDRGLTHLDTAELYGSGVVEEMVAEAIAGRRDELYLTSKVHPKNGSRAATIRACERSLARLGTDRLDLYLLHWPGPHPLEETLGAFVELQRAGKILRFGVSNFDVDDLAEACRIAGEGAIACDQVLYHLGERAIEHALLPFCEQRGVQVVGYSPFGSGAFPSPRSAGGRVIDEIARAHGASARQVALRFLVRRPSLLAIPKAARTEHVEDNAGALALRLSVEEIARIDAAFPPGGARELPTL